MALVANATAIVRYLLQFERNTVRIDVEQLVSSFFYSLILQFVLIFPSSFVSVLIAQREILEF